MYFLEQHEEEMIKSFSDYPCYGCYRQKTCSNTCDKYKTFIHTHWNNFRKTGKMLTHKKVIQNKQKLVRLVADVRDIMQSELNEWIIKNELDLESFPAIYEIINGDLVKRVVDRLLHGK